jgi:hypothetical protein
LDKVAPLVGVGFIGSRKTLQCHSVRGCRFPVQLILYGHFRQSASVLLSQSGSRQR